MGPRPAPENQQLLDKLTERERAVLAYLAKGAAHRDAVAQQLHLSVHTVRTHMRNLMAKLGAHSMLEAVVVTPGTRQAGFARTAAHHPDGRLRWIRRTGDYKTLM
jgi:DNA-binding NarL/FixJ family response regulator